MSGYRKLPTGWILPVLLLVCLTRTCFSQTLADASPAVSLFDSVERIRVFLAEETLEDYSGMYLSGITLHYFEDSPRQGLAWLYSFSFNSPRLGGEMCIAHYMDGEIIEIRLGP